MITPGPSPFADLIVAVIIAGIYLVLGVLFYVIYGMIFTCNIEKDTTDESTSERH